MSDSRISLKRTVYYSEETGEFCQCQGDFWKTCSLRVINRLPCTEAILSITPITRTQTDPAKDSIRSLDSSLAKLEDGLRALGKKLNI